MIKQDTQVLRMEGNYTSSVCSYAANIDEIITEMFLNEEFVEAFCEGDNAFAIHSWLSSVHAAYVLHLRCRE